MYAVISFVTFAFSHCRLEDWSMGSLTQLRSDTVYQLTQRLLTNTKASFFSWPDHLPFISDGLTPADDKGRFCF